MTLNERKSSRRASRHAAGLRRRRVRLAALGILTVTAALVVAAFVINWQSSGDNAGATTWSTPSYSGGPRLAVDRAMVDYGSVPYNHEVDATYRLKNVGDQSLTFQTPTVDTVEGC